MENHNDNNSCHSQKFSLLDFSFILTITYIVGSLIGTLLGYNLFA